MFLTYIPSIVKLCFGTNSSLKGKQREMVFGLIRPILFRKQGSKNFFILDHNSQRYAQLCFSCRIRRIRQKSLCVSLRRLHVCILQILSAYSPNTFTVNTFRLFGDDLVYCNQPDIRHILHTHLNTLHVQYSLNMSKYFQGIPYALEYFPCSPNAQEE